MATPYATFFEQLWGTFASFIVPVGFDEHHPVGTGPFRFQSFTPGQQSVFVRNPNYWKPPGPYVDTLTIIDYEDFTSLENAMLANEIDGAGGLAPASIGSLKTAGNLKLVVSPTGSFVPILMRVDVAPWSDVRVRQAMRLIVDRPALIETAYDGYARVGNDVFGIGFADFDSSLQRHQDIAQARSLLKAAGHSGLSAQLITSPAIAGMVETGEVFQQQAKLAGVNIALSNEPVSTFFGPGIYHRAFSENYIAANPYLVNVGFETLPNSPFSDTHFDDPKYTKLYSEANATTDASLSREIQFEMQGIDFTSGGYIIPAFFDNIDVYADYVEGTHEYATGLPLSNGFFAPMWLNK
jgi:peptide/nickel transport system substrate-binding protein